MVQKGRRYATIDVQQISEGPLWPVSLVGGAGGDRTSTRSGLRRAGHHAPARASSLDVSREVRRNAATRSGGLEYRATTAQWHAERAARRPKQAKLALNVALRTYVEERLAGGVIGPSSTPVPGPAVSWNGRRRGPRQDRRWANAWSPEQIARRLPVDFPDDETMRISHEAAHSGDHERSIRSIMNTEPGDHEHALAVILKYLDERRAASVGRCH